MKININQSCSVILQKRGVEAYNKYYRKLGLEPAEKYEVGDVAVMLLWEIMRIFGSACYMGPEPPFDTNIEIGEDNEVRSLSLAAIEQEKIQFLFESGKRAFKL
jgi:hypothetical protein